METLNNFNNNDFGSSFISVNDTFKDWGTGACFKGVGNSGMETHFTIDKGEYHASTYIDVGLGGKTKVSEDFMSDYFGG